MSIYDGFNRREFLKSTATLGAGVAAGSALGRTGFAESPAASETGTDTNSGVKSGEQTAAFWSTLDRLPMALIVDGPMPCVNPLYYFRFQVTKNPKPDHLKTIPVSMMEQFAELVVSHGVRGVFTVVPYPAGIGSIAKGLPGYPDAELERWLDIVRTHLLEGFDIHPEVLTHTNALDLETYKMRDVSEHDWMGEQNEATLTDYFVEAMSILKSVGLPCDGITQPCYFKGDEDAYARAILNAEKSVNDRKHVNYFLDVFQTHPFATPYCRHVDADADEYVVSVPGLFDGLWPANDGETDSDKMADFFLTADGKSGHLAKMLADRRPLVFSTHWQSLYGNGSLAGLLGLKTIIERIERNVDGVEWMKLSTISDLAIKAHREHVKS